MFKMSLNICYQTFTLDKPPTTINRHASLLEDHMHFYLVASLNDAIHAVIL